MYLHLGADCMVKNSDIIAIFTLRQPQLDFFQEYACKFKDRYNIVDASDGNGYYSVVLTDDTLYFSSISSLTLMKRAQSCFLADAVYINS